MSDLLRFVVPRSAIILATERGDERRETVLAASRRGPCLEPSPGRGDRPWPARAVRGAAQPGRARATHALRLPRAPAAVPARPRARAHHPLTLRGRRAGGLDVPHEPVGTAGDRGPGRRA